MDNPQGGSESEIELKGKISPELVKKYKEIFDSFDKEQSGYVQAKDVPVVMRILGVDMKEQEGTSGGTQWSRRWGTAPSSPTTRSSPARSSSPTSWPSS